VGAQFLRCGENSVPRSIYAIHLCYSVVKPFADEFLPESEDLNSYGDGASSFLFWSTSYLKFIELDLI
jgi:hypothetical protein